MTLARCRPQHLRREVCRRELQAEALRGGLAVDGERRQGHERVAVLHHHEEDAVARRTTRHLRQDHRGNGQCAAAAAA